MATPTNSFTKIQTAWHQVAHLNETELLNIDVTARVQLVIKAIQSLSKEPCQIKSHSPLIGKLMTYVHENEFPQFFHLLQAHDALFETRPIHGGEGTKKVANPVLLKVVEEAITNGNENLVIRLLDHGLPVHLNILLLAFEHNCDEIIKLIVKNNLLTKSILFKTVNTENKNLLINLLDRGIDVNTTNKNGHSLLYYACKDCPILVNELLKRGAQLTHSDPTLFIKKFAYFNLTPQQLIALIKCCFLKDPEITVKEFKKFNIKNEEERIELVDFFISNQAWAVIDSYQKFKISNEALRLHHAKRCGEFSPYLAPYVVRVIDNFNLSKNNLLEIAKFFAKIDGEAIAWNFAKFDIQSEEERYEIAQLCAQSSGQGTIANLEKFNITDKSQLLTIIALCARQNGFWTSFYFDSSWVPKEQKRIHIFKLCVAENTESMSNFSNFEIKNEKEVPLLLWSCARQNAEITSKNINKFKVTGQILQEVSHYCLKQCGIKIFYQMKIFDPERVKIKNISEASPENECLKKAIIAFNGIRLEAEDETVSQPLENVLDIIKCNLNNDLEKLGLTNKIDEIEKIEHPQTKYSKVLLLLELLFLKKFFLDKDLTKSQLNFIDQAYSFPRSDISLWLIRAACDNWTHSNYESLSFDTAMFPWKELVNESLVNLELKGFDHKILVEAINEIKKLVLFKDGKNIQTFIEMLCKLLQIDTLNVNKEEILLRIFIEGKLSAQANAEKRHSLNAPIELDILSDNPDKKVSRPIETLSPTNNDLGTAYLLNMNALIGICSFEEPILKLMDTKHSLIQQLELIMEEVLSIGQIPNFTTKFHDHFLQTRTPFAILTFIGKIKTLSERPSMECLVECVTSVLKGKYLELRYSTDNNPHLLAVEKVSSGLIKRWQQNLPPLKSTQSEEDKKKNADSIKSLLAYFNTELKLDYLNNYFEAVDDQEKVNIIKKCSENWENIKKKSTKNMSKESFLEFKKNKNNLKLQHTLFNLLSMRQIGSGKLLGTLNTLLGLLKEPQFPAYLITTLKELMQPLKKVDEVFIANESDDITDILNCGSEVANSCLKLSGETKNVKGLLAYIRDGKIKLLKISDPNDPEGKINTRCLLRILLLNGTPVLFREKIYPNIISEKQENVLNQLALKKGEALEIPVYIKSSSNDNTVTLKSLKGPATWEYCDSASGNKREGIYEIPNCKKLVL